MSVCLNGILRFYSLYKIIDRYLKVLIMNHSCSGISEEKTLNPVQLATMKAERIAREKAAAAQNAAVSS